MWFDPTTELWYWDCEFCEAHLESDDYLELSRAVDEHQAEEDQAMEEEAALWRR